MNGEVSFYKLTKRSFWFWLGAFLLLIGTPITYFGVRGLIREIRYQQGSESVEGVVVALTQETTGSGTKRRTNHYVSYRFTYAGASHENRSKVGSEIWRELREQGPVRIQVRTDDPDVNRVAGTEDWAEGLIGTILGGAFVGVGAFMFAKGLRQVLLERRLLRDGVPVEATVTEVKQTNISVNKVKQCVVHYTYRDLYGREHLAKSFYMPPGEAYEWNPGDKGTARFDSSQPELSVWVGGPRPPGPESLAEEAEEEEEENR